MKKLLFVICFALSGCAREPDEVRSERILQGNLDALSNHLVYYKDTRVNVCYSGSFIGYNFGTFTSVPCSPEVEKVAHQFQSNPIVR